MARERTWRQMSKAERLDLVVSSQDVSDAVAARVIAYFQTRPADPFELVVNVVMREAWREEHGNTREWDHAACAGISDPRCVPAEVLIVGGRL